MSDHEHRNSLVITNPKSVALIADLQSNANYENALQIVKANVNPLFLRIIFLSLVQNMRRKKLEALIEIDNKI